MKRIILVDKDDKLVDFGEKLDVHRKGILHRAFSVFVYDGDNRLLIQKRADGKYHSGGKWSNSCCSHQYDNETLSEAVYRCMNDELAIEKVNVLEMAEKGSFLYYADLGEMKEHEIDHVFRVVIDDNNKVKANPDEICGLRWMTADEIKGELSEDRDSYSAWFESAFEICEADICN